MSDQKRIKRTWKFTKLKPRLYCRLYVPAIREFSSHIFEVVIPHIVDIEDEALLVLGDAIPYVLEQLLLLLAGLLGDLR